MLAALPSLATHPFVFWALQSVDHSEPAYFVIVGLAIIGAVEIAAGLYMVRTGERHRGIRR